MFDVNLALPCFFHYFRLPTSGTITIKPMCLEFNGVHVNNENVEKVIPFTDIISIQKGTTPIIFTLETHMMRYYTCITTKREQLYFSGFTMTQGMCQDKFISYVTEKIAKPSTEILSSLIKAKESGIDTLNILKKDDEMMKKNDSNMKEMEYNLTLSERLATGFNSITGTVKNYFSGAPDSKTLTKPSPTTKSGTNTTQTTDPLSTQQQEIKIISDLLDQVKAVSLEISDSLDQSNTSLTKLTAQVDNANDKMKKTNQKLDKITKKI